MGDPDPEGELPGERCPEALSHQQESRRTIPHAEVPLIYELVFNQPEIWARTENQHKLQ